MMFQPRRLWYVTILLGGLATTIACTPNHPSERKGSRSDAYASPALLELRGQRAVELGGGLIHLALVNRSAHSLSLSRTPRQMLPGRVMASAPLRVRLIDSNGALQTPDVVVDDGLFDEPSCFVIRPGEQVPISAGLRREWFPRLLAGQYFMDISYHSGADPCANDHTGWVVTISRISVRVP